MQSVPFFFLIFTGVLPMTSWLKTGLVLVFTLVVAVFMVQNIQTVTVVLFTSALTLPLALLVIGVYVLGMVTGGSLLSLLRTAMRKDKVEENNH